MPVLQQHPDGGHWQDASSTTTSPFNSRINNRDCLDAVAHGGNRQDCLGAIMEVPPI
ncbi:MAG: hypothetical protein F6K65_13865 [Moorea sp. SIO3C2]|nr:hypothetical protein [Moorena sp. SIO3C2]